jgi:flagellar L-ring protein precursor FlgH
MKRSIVFAAFMIAALSTSGIAQADTLYVAPPNNVEAGRPLRLGPDHRAGQVGDIVNVVFAFAATDSESDTTTTTKGFNAGAQQGTNSAIKLFNIINIPTSITGSSGDNYTRTHAISNTFSTTMMATVVSVLPSGALVIAGDQLLNVNGVANKMHVTGVVRTEDIDNTDSVPSNRIANVQARFTGNFSEGRPGIVQRLMNFLF